MDVVGVKPRENARTRIRIVNHLFYLTHVVSFYPVVILIEAPFFSRDLAIGTVLIFLGGILTSGGGLGGGGVYIPILVLVLGLSPHVAVPLSKVNDAIILN